MWQTAARSSVDGNRTVGNISGAGNTILDAGAVLTVGSVVQGTLTLGAGATLNIAPLPGGPLAGGVGMTAVPEPSTWVLLVLAAMVLGIYRRRSR